VITKVCKDVSCEGIADHVWHILSVTKDSPASTAGLEPLTDYIIGAPSQVFENGRDLFKLIESRNQIALGYFYWVDF
jgi:hypothetical protein